MKRRVLIVPLDVITEEMFTILRGLTDANAETAKEKGALLARLRAAGKTGEVDWETAGTGATNP